jgi:hypothetical protein
VGGQGHQRVTIDPIGRVIEPRDPGPASFPISSHACSGGCIFLFVVSSVEMAMPTGFVRLIALAVAASLSCDDGTPSSPKQRTDVCTSHSQQTGKVNDRCVCNETQWHDGSPPK